MKISRVWLPTAFVALASCAPTVTLPTAELAITNVVVIDGHGGPAILDQTILIADRRIAVIAPSQRVEVPDGARVIEGEGKLADLVLLEADPLLDIRNTSRIAAVIANGEVAHENTDLASEVAR